jgi:hypothetical protein
MKIVFFILMVLQTTLNAQNDYTFNSSYRSFKEGKSFYALRSSSIHVAPFVTATVLGKVRTGDVVRVEERMDEIFKVEGFRTNWYRITFDNKGQSEEGYIWGGNLAIGAFNAQEKEEVLFLYGVDHIGLVNRGNYTEESIQLCLYTLLYGKVQDSVVFEAMGTLYTKTQGRAYGNKGLDGVKEIIELAFSDGYCGGVAATVTIFWDGQKVHYVNLLSNGFSSETFANRFYIYPKEHLKEAKMVLLRTETGTFDINKHPVYKRQVDQQYIWVNNKLKVMP